MGIEDRFPEKAIQERRDIRLDGCHHLNREGEFVVVASRTTLYSMRDEVAVPIEELGNAGGVDLHAFLHVKRALAAKPSRSDTFLFTALGAHIRPKLLR